MVADDGRCTAQRQSQPYHRPLRCHYGAEGEAQGEGEAKGEEEHRSEVAEVETACLYGFVKDVELVAWFSHRGWYVLRGVLELWLGACAVLRYPMVARKGVYRGLMQAALTRNILFSRYCGYEEA